MMGIKGRCSVAVKFSAGGEKKGEDPDPDAENPDDKENNIGI